VVAEPRLWVDVESAIREWARDSVASVDRRVFFSPNNAAAFPQISLSRIAGPDDRCLIQFDAWAAHRAEAAQTAAELATAADAIGRYAHDGVLLHGALVESVRWQPDEQSDTARYVVEATFAVTSAP
jgi:hypothetical protein